MTTLFNLITNHFLEVINTLVLALTAAILYRYTDETNKIRVETKTQNDLLSEQLRLAKSQIDRDTKREESVLDAFLASEGGMTSSDSMRFRFKNAGSLISNLEVELDGEQRVAISPQHSLATNDTGYISMFHDSKPMPSTGFFILRYRDKFGGTRSKRYRYEKEGMKFFETNLEYDG